jgi:hypothetical protein
MRVKMKEKKDIQYPISYVVNVYPSDLHGDRIGNTPRYSYNEVVNNEEENRKFLESFDGGNFQEIIIL